MSKSEMVTLLYLMKSDLSHLDTYSDYVKQFYLTLNEIESVEESLKESGELSGDIR